MDDLIARKRFRYAGRSLRPGDPFTPAKRSDRKVLVATGRAREVEVGVMSAPAPKRRTKDVMDDDGNGSPGGSRRQAPDPELTAARQEYTTVTGKRFFSGWSLEEIREKTAQARQVSAGNTGGGDDQAKDAEEEDADTSPPAEDGAE